MQNKNWKSYLLKDKHVLFTCTPINLEGAKIWHLIGILLRRLVFYICQLVTLLCSWCTYVQFLDIKTKQIKPKEEKIFAVTTSNYRFFLISNSKKYRKRNVSSSSQKTSMILHSKLIDIQGFWWWEVVFLTCKKHHSLQHDVIDMNFVGNVCG